MSGASDRLYDLLPAAHQIRDAERGYPFRALLRVIREQADIIEKDIAQLYDNWFIETCEDWVVPYLGDLIGYRPVSETGGGSGNWLSENNKRNLNKVLVPRRDVATTLGLRRRKGTPALLEVLANNAAGWPARPLEFYTLLGWTQHLNHLHPERAQTVELRNSNALDFIDGPFERLAHTADVRRISSERSSGRHNIPVAGLLVWRLKPYSVTHTPAYCVEDEGLHCFTFSILGNNTPLYTRPEPEAAPRLCGRLKC